MTAKRGRTQKCGATQARQRLAQARSYLDVASLTADENDPTLEYAGVAASVAISLNRARRWHRGWHGSAEPLCERKTAGVNTPAKSRLHRLDSGRRLWLWQAVYGLPERFAAASAPPLGCGDAVRGLVDERRGAHLRYTTQYATIRSVHCGQ